VETLSQISVVTLTLLCAGLCVVGILVGGLGLLVVRSGLFGGLLGGLRDTLAGQEEEPVGRIPVARARRSSLSSVDDIRARYDRQFYGEIEGEDAVGDFPERDVSVQDREPYKRRFREENADFDDEMDAFFDDMEL